MLGAHSRKFSDGIESKLIPRRNKRQGSLSPADITKENILKQFELGLGEKQDMKDDISTIMAFAKGKYGP